MLGKQCCCDNSQKMSERERLISAPAHTRDSFLGSSFSFGGLWTRGCLRARFEVINKFECSIFNFNFQWMSASFCSASICGCFSVYMCSKVHLQDYTCKQFCFSHNYCGDPVEPLLYYLTTKIDWLTL